MWQSLETTKCVYAALLCKCKIIRQSGLLFLMFITAVYVNNMTPAWTFVRAVSSLPCATFLGPDTICCLLYPQAVWGNQRRAALIAWPWQDGRWSGMGHHPPGERAPLFLSTSSLPFFPFNHQEVVVHSLKGGAAKSPQPNAHLIL